MEMNENKSRFTTKKIVQVGLMAAIVCVITFFRFPLLGSKVHFANTFCLLSGLFLGAVPGGLAAGIGSALYDVLFGGYDFIQSMITFVSKFLMAFICAKIAEDKSGRVNMHAKVRLPLACIAGALSYIALYMLRTFIYQAFVYGFPMDAVGVTMLAKLPASLINGVVAIITAPVLFRLLEPALIKVIRK